MAPNHLRLYIRTIGGKRRGLKAGKEGLPRVKLGEKGCEEKRDRESDLYFWFNFHVLKSHLPAV